MLACVKKNVVTVLNEIYDRHNKVYIPFSLLWDSISYMLGSGKIFYKKN